MDEEIENMFSFSVEQCEDEHVATQFILDKLNSKNNRVVYETVLKVSPFLKFQISLP
jgi:hypothetical protein